MNENLPGPKVQPVPEMDLREFLEAGYLQEVNRLFFHPLGLALSVKVDEAGRVQLHNIWDGRDDPEGFTFAQSEWTEADSDRARKILAERNRRLRIRRERLGFAIQPL